jgi:beta-lactamase class C
MHQKKIKLLSILALGWACAASNHAAADEAASIKTAMDQEIMPLMQQYKIPGMAIGVTIDGRRYFHEYGVENIETRQPITVNTLFEIGSISKTFTAALASYAQVNGKLSWLDSTSTHLPALRASSFDQISLLNLATHTSGGLPLQVPYDIKNNDQLMAYFRYWHPLHPAGTDRSYSNPGIGLLGIAAAASMGMSFDDAIEKKLFPELGMRHSYLRMPASQVKHYAQGYTKNDEPIRLTIGVLASQAYGIRSGTQDMIRFIDANLQAGKLRSNLERALQGTHTGYFQVGAMTQALAWERYPYPLTLEQLLAGNSDTMAYQATPTTRLDPPLPPQADTWINKSGSTKGFTAYVAFIPDQQMGIVMLANKHTPIAPQVTAAYRILTQLTRQAAPKERP